MTEAAGERFAGMEIDDARDAVIDALRAEGAISGTQPYVARRAALAALAAAASSR